VATDTDRRARRGRLSKAGVLKAAVALADEAGIDSLTMRGIGQRLGVEAMSLYRHVENKEDLLDGMIDVVWGEIELPARGEGWKAAMCRRAIAVRAALARHPWAIGLMESRLTPGPQNLRHRDSVLEVLLGAGFSGRTATHAYNLLDSYIYGFAVQETNLPFGSAEELAAVGEEMLRQMPTDEYPNLARVAGELLESGFDYADEFEFGLDLILDALERFYRESTHAAG